MNNSSPIANQKSRWVETSAFFLSLFSVIAAIRSCQISDISAEASASSAKSASDSVDVSKLSYELSKKEFETDISNTQVEKKNELFLRLRQTEARYQMIVPENLRLSNLNDAGDLGQPLKLVILRQEARDRIVLTFRLPRAAKTPQLPVSIQSVSPFECIDCTNNYRLQLYAELTQLLPSMTELSASDLVSLARAAHDFGNIEDCKKSLTSAKKLIDKKIYPEAYNSDILGEIGKTCLIMGETEKGYALLTTSRELWKKQKHPFRTNPIYNSLLWEAQFACRNKDKVRATGLLNDLAKDVATLSVSVSRQHELIHDAYASCIVILGEFLEPDPVLPVPIEHLLRDTDGQWKSAYLVLKDKHLFAQ